MPGPGVDREPVASSYRGTATGPIRTSPPRYVAIAPRLLHVRSFFEQGVKTFEWRPLMLWTALHPRAELDLSYFALDGGECHGGGSGHRVGYCKVGLPAARGRRGRSDRSEEAA